MAELRSAINGATDFRSARHGYISARVRHNKRIEPLHGYIPWLIRRPVGRKPEGVTMFKFKCPKCNQYVEMIGELIPLNEELELHCSNCREETAVLSLRPTTGAVDGAESEHCLHCSHFLEPAWHYCPECGTPRKPFSKIGYNVAKEKNKYGTRKIT